jgi:TolA-binding protein
MRLLYLGAITLLILPAALPAASKDMEELQRDVGMLQDQVRALQKSQDDKMAALADKVTALTVLVQQSLDQAGKANTGVAVIQNGFRQNLQDLENKVVAPVVGANTRMDQMANDFRTLQQAVSDLTNLMGKLQAQMTDLTNAVKVIQAPTPAPPGDTGAPGAAANTGTPPVSASDLYTNAGRDRTSGKLDLALNEYAQYLQYYSNTVRAPNAQFYIAFIHYSQGDYDNALKEFDAVLEKYPDDTNNKIPDALYYKGMTLVKLGRRTQGANEFLELLKRFPSHDLARQACSQRLNMGLKCVVPRSGAKKRS